MHDEQLAANLFRVVKDEIIFGIGNRVCEQALSVSMPFIMARFVY